MKNIIIESHAHVYPPLGEVIKSSLDFLPITLDSLDQVLEKIDLTSNYLKSKIKPLILNKLDHLHTLSNNTRNLPEQYIEYADRLQSVLWPAGILLEGKVSDLIEQMNINSVDYSVIIAHPPVISNEFILQLANNDSRFIPIVNVSPCKSSKEKLEHYIELGAKGLKIHPASDGLDAFNDHYLKLLEIASTYNLPVIIHTGSLNIKPIYKDPNMGHAEHFESWFNNFPQINFVLAHMNIHYPQVAIDFCKDYSNVYTDTSWQPKEWILEAISQIGADKIMFGSDWPIIGNNISNGLSKIEALLQEEKITETQANQVKGLTAAKIFNINLEN